MGKLCFDADFDEAGKIICFTNGDLLEDGPEERVRQKILKLLAFEYNYDKKLMAREVAIQHGSDILRDREGNPIYADVVIYSTSEARANRDQGNILFVVECKAPNKNDGYNQLVSYIFNTSASGGVWYNGSGDADEIAYYRRIDSPQIALIPWPGIPRYNESWDAIGRVKKSELKKPKDIKSLLRRCHNKLHARGTEEDDLTMDMVRIILAKAMDEEEPGDIPSFYCTPEEYNSEDGQRCVEQRIQALFDKVKHLNRQVFEQHERISVGPRAICDVVSELQRYQLLSDIGDAHDWDLMGAAYEEYTQTYLKRKKGQFFTNRLVVNFLVEAIDPTPTDIVLDPAGGSGGFITGTIRYVRSKIVSGTGSPISKERQLDRIRKRLFMVESSKRLVKVAKTAMILNGDGHTGISQGDSLGPYSGFNETILAECNKGVPTVILTNPPFAGTEDGKITHKETLLRFKTGRKWTVNDNNYVPTDEILSDGAPPELLFLERCIDWLAPGGRLGIVLPKGFLDVNAARSARQNLFNNCRLSAVINLHKNTFQPHTGTRTCLVILEKFSSPSEQPKDYPIFMAISRKVGQDSEGKPTYVLDNAGNPTEKLDQDLDTILDDYKKFKRGEFKDGTYCFTVMRSQIGEFLRINPQAYIPHLNETVRQVSLIEEQEGWTVTELGQISQNIKIFKGPRLKSENLITEETTGEHIEAYYTPSAVLQEKQDGVKYLDLSKADGKQLRTIESIRVHDGYILITRSGSTGRVVLLTSKFENAIVSDDAIRVVIPDEILRHYVYCFLLSPWAQDQLKRNEYGSIQQHVEPSHVKELLIPLPTNRVDLEKYTEIGKTSIKAKRLKEEYDKQCENAQNLLSALIWGVLGDN